MQPMPEIQADDILCNPKSSREKVQQVTRDIFHEVLH